MISPRLSVVIPAYNERLRIRPTLEDVAAHLAVQDYSSEVIVVDNGSRDGTADVVREFQEQDARQLIRLCRTPYMGGKGSAVRFGITQQARGRVVMFMDADNATPIREIEKFWPYLDRGFSVVIGSRYVEHAEVIHRQPALRILLSRLGNILTRALVDPAIKDTQLGFKAFTQQAAAAIFSRATIDGWAFDMEVLTIARAHGWTVKEVGVLWRERGGSHVPPSGYLQTLRDLARIKMNALAGRYER